MSDELARMRTHSGPSQSRCGACELEADMTPEDLATFRKAYETRGINTTGMLWWLEEKGYKLDRRAPAKVLLNHRKCISHE